MTGDRSPRPIHRAQVEQQVVAGAAAFLPGRGGDQAGSELEASIALEDRQDFVLGSYQCTRSLPGTKAGASPRTPSTSPSTAAGSTLEPSIWRRRVSRVDRQRTSGPVSGRRCGPNVGSRGPAPSSVEVMSWKRARVRSRERQIHLDVRGDQHVPDLSTDRGQTGTSVLIDSNTTDDADDRPAPTSRDRDHYRRRLAPSPYRRPMVWAIPSTSTRWRGRRGPRESGSFDRRWSAARRPPGALDVQLDLSSLSHHVVQRWPKWKRRGDSVFRGPRRSTGVPMRDQPSADLGRRGRRTRPSSTAARPRSLHRADWKQGDFQVSARMCRPARSQPARAIRRRRPGATSGVRRAPAEPPRRSSRPARRPRLRDAPVEPVRAAGSIAASKRLSWRSSSPNSQGWCRPR